MWYKQKTKALFISDLAALQSTLAIKGSSGLKPCLWCQNILKKDSGLSDDRFRDISEHDVSRFEMASDATIWACCDHIAERIPHLNVKMREQLEKSYGITYVPQSILFDASLRPRLRPSDVCLDSMHNYFSNGVANQELCLFWHAISKATDLKLEDLRTVCLESQWEGPKVSSHGRVGYMKSLWTPKMWNGDTYKGQSEQCESVLPLMRWYAEILVVNVDSLRLPLDSFRTLSEIAMEIRKLVYMWRKITPDHVAKLQRLQTEHQLKFSAAYTAQCCRPKHHHRLHLPDSWLKLGVALSCKPMESKHKCYKQGLAERFVSKVEAGFAAALLPRMLHSQAQTMAEHMPPVLQPLQFLSPLKAASESILETWQRPTAILNKTAAGVKVYNSTAKPGDVLIFPDAAGILQWILTDGSHGVFLLQRLELVPSTVFNIPFPALSRSFFLFPIANIFHKLHRFFDMKGFYAHPRSNSNMATALGISPTITGAGPFLWKIPTPCLHGGDKMVSA